MKTKKTEQANLVKNTRGYFIMGLTFAIFVSWRTLEVKSSYAIDYSTDFEKYEALEGETINIPIEEPDIEIKEEVIPPPQEPDFEIVKNDETSSDLQQIFTEASQQSKKSRPIKPTIKRETKVPVKKKKVPFISVESKPVYPGCEKISNAKQLDCFSKKLDKLLVRYSDDIADANEEGLTGRLILQLKINEDGSVQNSVLRGVHKDVDGAIQKILKKIPKVQPGKQRNEPVTVTLTKPIRISG